MTSSVGSMRYTADKRQIAALMMVTGICAVFQPLANIATAIGPNGTTPTTGLDFAGLLGGLCLVAIGSLSLFIGYNELVHDWGNKHLTFALIVLTQTAFIPYLTDMTNIGRAAHRGAGFIPAEFNPTASNVRFVGAMGILSVLSYGFTFVGSISFMQFSLFAFQSGRPQERNASYYAGRLKFYTAMLFVAGLSQLLLGAYVQNQFGSGALPQTIGVAVYVVNFPAMNIFLGLMQMILAVVGMVLSVNKIGNETLCVYQACMFGAWFLQLVLQVLTQVGYAPSGVLAPAAPTIAAISVGLNLMPAYLEYKARNVPEVISNDYYGLNAPTEKTKEAGDTSMASDNV